MCTVKWNVLWAEEKKPIPLLTISGGYLDTRKYAGSLLQIDYKYAKYLGYHLRPQVTLLVSQFYSGYIGFGLGWEFYLNKQMMIIPSFSPGIYWKGKGRRLGYPIEFQSTLEIAYEREDNIRIGFKISHVSNAHLSHINPGFNGFTLSISFPLSRRE